jgi:hypothetical protein
MRGLQKRGFLERAYSCYVPVDHHSNTDEPMADIAPPGRCLASYVFR